MLPQWTGNCIGRRNYKYFLSFLLSLTLYIDFVFAMCVSSLVHSLASHSVYDSHRSEHLVIQDLRENSVLISVAIFLFLCGSAMNPLSFYHMHLLSRGVTTNEDLKRIYPDGRLPQNPGFWSNLTGVCCAGAKSRLPPMNQTVTAYEYLMATHPQLTKSQA